MIFIIYYLENYILTLASLNLEINEKSIEVGLVSSMVSIGLEIKRSELETSTNDSKDISETEIKRMLPDKHELGKMNSY